MKTEDLSEETEVLNGSEEQGPIMRVDTRKVNWEVKSRKGALSIRADDKSN